MFDGGGGEQKEIYQSISTRTDYDDNSTNNNNRSSSSNSSTSNKKMITDYTSRRSELLTNIQELQVLQKEAKTIEEKEACQKGIFKNVQDLRNLNVQEQANWFQNVT